MSDDGTRIALVTGAGSGIGRAVALALADDGWSVALAGRRGTALDETATLAGDAAAARLLAVPTDVTDPVSVDRLFAAVASRWKRLDLVFNNAGIARDGRPDLLPVETWHEVIATNLTGAFLLARGAFRLMHAQTPQGGRIINNGSISAQVPRPHSIAYTASKHAVTGLTKSLALDGRPFGIACGQIDIGNAASEMTEKMAGGVLQADGTRAAEPVMAVGDVARAVLLMASLPAGANIPQLTVMATAMPFVGRG